jgi:hypothetical protein
MQVAQGYAAQPYGPQGYGAPPQGSQAMQPYGQPGMAAAPAMGAPAPSNMVPWDGTNGPKGQIRKGTQVLLYSVLTCGIYQMIWFVSICKEMSAFLKRDEPNWLKVIGLSLVTCNVYGLYWFAVKLGALIGEIQQRAGVPNPQNLGFMYVIPYYNLILITDELNKAWQQPG